MRPETVKTWCKSKKTQKWTFLSKSQDVEFVELALEKGQQQKERLWGLILLWCKMESLCCNIQEHGVKLKKMEGPVVAPLQQ